MQGQVNGVHHDALPGVDMAKVIGSETWKVLTEEYDNAGRPQGHHIRDGNDEAEIVADRDDGAHNDQIHDQVRRYIEHMSRPKTDDSDGGKRRPWTKGEVISLIGLLVTLVIFVGGIVAWGVTQTNGIYGTINASNAANDKQLATSIDGVNKQFVDIGREMVSIQDAIKTLAQVFKDDQDATRDRSTKYIPQIEKTAGEQAMLNERVKSIADSIADMRDSEAKSNADMRNAIQDLTKGLGAVNTDVQVLKAQSSLRSGSPRDMGR